MSIVVSKLTSFATSPRCPNLNTKTTSIKVSTQGKMGFWTNKNEGIWSEMIHHHWQYLFGVENKPHLKKPYKDLSLTILKFLVSMIIFGCCILKTLLVCQLVTRIHLRSRRLWTFMLSKIANLGGPPCTSGMIYIYIYRYDIYIWSYIYIIIYLRIHTKSPSSSTRIYRLWAPSQTTHGSSTPRYCCAASLLLAIWRRASRVT